MIDSASKIVVESLHRHTSRRLPLPAGIPSEKATHCAACGVQIRQGDPMVRFRPNVGSFTDWQYMTHEFVVDGQFPICPYCAALFPKDFLQHQAMASSAVYSRHGAWMMTLDVERAWFLLTPPEPPFVAYVATTMGQHVVWRTPVTIDRDYLRVGIARSVLSIDRPLLMAASEMCRELVWSANADVEAGRADKSLKNTKNFHPFSFLDRKMEGAGHGELRSVFRRWMQDRGLHAQIDFLESLGEGELWGLAVLNKAKQEAPVETRMADKLASKAKEKAAKQRVGE